MDPGRGTDSGYRNPILSGILRRPFPDFSPFPIIPRSMDTAPWPRFPFPGLPPLRFPFSHMLNTTEVPTMTAFHPVASNPPAGFGTHVLDVPSSALDYGMVPYPQATVSTLVPGVSRSTGSAALAGGAGSMACSATLKVLEICRFCKKEFKLGFSCRHHEITCSQTRKLEFSL